MDGHHADAVAARLHVALDGYVGALDFVEKGEQRWGIGLFEGEGEREEFVDRIARLRPQPRQDRLPAAILAEQAGVECEGRKVARALAPFLQPLLRPREARL